MIVIIHSQTRFSFAHAHAHAHTHTLTHTHSHTHIHTHTHSHTHTFTHTIPLFACSEIFQHNAHHLLFHRVALLKVRFSLLISGRKIPITTCARARTTNPRPPVLLPTAQSQWTAAPGGSPRCGRSRRSGPPSCCPRARPRGRLR